MAQILRQSTAIDVRVGPCVDATDGVTPETGITIAAADQAEILKADGAATAAMAGVLAAVTGADGWYDYTMSTSDTDTVGTLDLVLQDSSVMLPVFVRFQVLDAVAFDTLYAASPTLLTPADCGLLYESTIGTVTSQTEFIMDVAFAVNDTHIGSVISLEDVSTGEVYSGNIWISDSVQSTESLLINTAFPVTVVANDIIRVYAEQHSTFALDAYDGPTRAEATTDKLAILADALETIQVTARSDAAIATDNAAKITSINANEGSGGGNYLSTSDSLEAQADVSTETRLAELDAANLPAGVDAIPTTAMRGTDNAATAAEILTTQLTEAYAADGVAPTLSQLLFLVQQSLGDFKIMGTTLTVRKIDGATTAATFTLDDGTAPTDITRTT